MDIIPQRNREIVDLFIRQISITMSKANESFSVRMTEEIRIVGSKRLRCSVYLDEDTSSRRHPPSSRRVRACWLQLAS